MCRLVKGAYWDAEIKRAQELGLPHYPVYTHKNHTDISYLACARALLEVVLRHAAEVHLVSPRQARACTFEELLAFVPAAARPRVRRGTVEGIFPDARTCTAGGADDTVVVTGSIYLLGEVLERIEPARGAGEGKLQDF